MADVNNTMDPKDPDYKDYQDYLEYQQYLKGFQRPPAVPTSPDNDSLASKVGSGLKSLLEARNALGEGLVKGASLGYIDPSKPSSLDPLHSGQTIAKASPTAFEAGNIAGSAVPGAAAGGAVGALTKAAGLAPVAGEGVLPALAKANARVWTNTAAGAAQGAAQNPEEGQTRTGNAQQGAKWAGILSPVAEAAGKVGQGLEGAGDWMMQKAVKMRKYLPGVGTTLADQGVMGTKAGMADQVGDRINTISKGIGSKVSALEGVQGVDSARAAQPLYDYADSMKVGNSVPGHSQADYEDAIARADEVAARGVVPGTEAWDYASSAGSRGYKHQKAMESSKAKLAQLEQQGYSEELKSQYENVANGDPSVRDAFSKLSDLYKAKSSLSQPDTIRQGAPMTTIFATGLGSAAAGAPGATAGYLASQAARTAPVQSAAGQALTKGGQAAQAAPQGVQPLVQYLFNRQRGANDGQTP